VATYYTKNRRHGDDGDNRGLNCGGDGNDNNRRQQQRTKLRRRYSRRQRRQRQRRRRKRGRWWRRRLEIYSRRRGLYKGRGRAPPPYTFLLLLENRGLIPRLSPGL